MNYKEILTELNLLIHKLNDIIDIMIMSTGEIIDTGNVNYELKSLIDRLDLIIDNIGNSNEKSVLESAKYDITYATVDTIDNADIFDKINRLKNAKGSLEHIKDKLSVDRYL